MEQGRLFHHLFHHSDTESQRKAAKTAVEERRFSAASKRPNHLLSRTEAEASLREASARSGERAK